MSAITELLDAPRLDGAACVGRGELFFAAPSELSMAGEARAHRSPVRSRGLVVDVTATGTHWSTTGGAQ